jgi:lysine/ornithine N-monooxygenase
VRKLLEWLIIGGGIQGTTIATFLIKTGKASIANLRVLDPYEVPLANWTHCTSIISMPFLRSPSVHHIDVDPFSLQSFMKQQHIAKTEAFYGPYKRPSLEIFQEHCQYVLAEIELEKAWYQGRATGLKRNGNEWMVTTTKGETLSAKRVVLAFGVNEQHFWPEWAHQLKQEGGAIYHVFDRDLPDLESLQNDITIIGGGITAVHLAIKLGELYPGKVSMIKRHPFRVHDFDSDPAWLGPRNQKPYRMVKDYKRRRTMIINARHKGSIPRELYYRMIHLERSRKIKIMDDHIQSATINNKEMILRLEQNGLFSSSFIILATGFEAKLPQSKWLMPLIQEEKLKCAECGYPIVTETLEWAPNLYVAGALAELEIGPISRNISGARQAAKIIANSV